jgi:hypothetical protein
MGMFEYRKEDEQIIVRHLVYGMAFMFLLYWKINNRQCLCGLVVRVSGYRSRGSGFDSWRYQDFLRSSGSGMGSTQPREYNWGATWKKR